MTYSNQPAPSTGAPAPAATNQSAPPAANITRSDSVVGGNAPAAATQGGTVQPGGNNAPLTPQTQQQGPGSGFTLIMLGLPIFMIVLFWFNSRADKKKRAEIAATLASIQRNDKVVTIGGIIGTVADIQDSEVVLKTDEIVNSRVRVEKSAIKGVLNRAGGKPATATA